MHRTARLLCAALALAPLVPLAACRHGGEGLITDQHGAAKPSRPAGPDFGRPEPPAPVHRLAGLGSGFPLSPPPHRHSGAPAPTHTYHLFAPRHR